MDYRKAFLTLCLIFISPVFAGKDLEKPWQALKATFPFYNDLPLTVVDAKDHDFKPFGHDHTCSGSFEGYRYMKNNDPSIILLYDENDYIAGIQSCFLESEIQQLTYEDEKHWFHQHESFVVEKFPASEDTCYTLTYYFVDPDLICTTGRSKEEFRANPSGNNLYIKTGTHNVLIPNDASGLADTKWTLSKCFPAMGTHYYYNLVKDMDCNSLFPFFLMYDDDKVLKNFGFIVFGKFTSSNYETSNDLIRWILIYTVPTCLKGKIMTSMHIPTVSNTNKLICPNFWKIG